MSDSLPAEEHRSRVTFQTRDDLPNVCVVCGASATGQCSLKVEMPADPDAKALTLLQMVGLLFGFIFVWWRTTPGPPDNRWIQLPRCDSHGSVDEIRSAVTISAVNRYTIEICGIFG